MIYLYSATPGTGKTCWVVKQLVDDWLTNPDNEGRKIYANIADLKIEGVYKPPDDFRECEDGSIIIYDEAQDIEHYSSDSRAINPVAKELSKHRHRGFDIHFITQDPSLLHKYVLKNVFMHYYLWRPAQRKNIEIFTFARAIVSPTKDDFKNAFDKRLWRFEPHYLQYYKSTVVNTSKKQSSQKIIGIMVTGLLFAGMIGAMIVPAIRQSKAINKPDDASTQLQSTPQQLSDTSQTPQQSLSIEQVQQQRRYILHAQMLPSDYEIIKSDPALQVRGVIAMGDICKAYNTYGDLMTLDYDTCKWYLAEPGRVHKDYQSDQPITTADSLPDNTDQIDNISNNFTMLNPSGEPPNAANSGL